MHSLQCISSCRMQQKSYRILESIFYIIVSNGYMAPEDSTVAPPVVAQ